MSGPEVAGRRRRGLVLAAALALAVQPAAATHRESPRSGIEELGFHPLLGTGFNTDVWAHPTRDGRLFAYTGTWGTLTGFGEDPCPSETDDPASPAKSGIKVVDATDPRNPRLAGVLGTVRGAQSNDVKVGSVETASFSGDILVHSLEPCGAEGLVAQLAGAPVTSVPLPQTGFQLYDVTDPPRPRQLGTYNNGGIGTHQLFLYSRPDLGRAFVATILNEVVALEVVGTMQIVEITDPSAPRLVSEWRLSDGGLECPDRGRDSAFCFLHDIWLSPDGRVAYLSFWDAGLVVVDVGDPGAPRLAGQALRQVDGDGTGWLDEEGNTHSAIPVTIGGRTFAVVTDEDFTGGGSTAVRVNAPAEAAASHPATRWEGTAEVTETGVTGDLVYAGTGCSGLNYVAFAPQVRGRVALVDKYEGQNATDRCPTFTFQQKVQAAEAAGAIALVQVDDDDVPSGGAAVAAAIPGVEIDRTAGDPLKARVLAGETVNVTVHRGEPVDPWGFLRVVDVSAADPGRWRQVFTFKAPHVEDPSPGPEDTFTAHDPYPGPDGRIYVAWYTDGVRVLEPEGDGGGLREVAWFVPLPTDHPDDHDEDPHGVQEANTGFWGAFPIRHPATGQLLVFASDLNRGMYVLGVNLPEPGVQAPAPARELPATGPAAPAGAGAALLVAAGLLVRSLRGRGGTPAFRGGTRNLRG